MPIIQNTIKPKPTRTRGALNEILTGRLYQRGQIMTWQREKKYSLLQEYGIKTVINFWPKIDPDMGEAPIDNYLHLAAVKSELMLEHRMTQAADMVARLSATSPTLVLCEAGVTRSVYFCILLLSRIERISLTEAKTRIDSVFRTRLKPFMLKRISEESK